VDTASVTTAPPKKARSNEAMERRNQTRVCMATENLVKSEMYTSLGGFKVICEVVGGVQSTIDVA